MYLEKQGHSHDPLRPLQRVRVVVVELRVEAEYLQLFSNRNAKLDYRPAKGASSEASCCEAHSASGGSAVALKTASAMDYWKIGERVVGRSLWVI